MNDYTQTPNLGLYKPEVNADYDLWGDHLNANADILDGILQAKAVLSDTAPANPRPGDLWFDTVNAQLYVWDVDPTSSQWTIATAQNSAALISDLPPPNPTKGQFWFDSVNPQLYVWHVDPTGPGQWVVAVAAAQGPPGPPGSVSGGTVTGPLYVTATGGTVARSAQDRAGQVIDIRDLGAACNGTTDDTAAWTAAFAKPDGTVIRVPQNCTTIVGNGFFQSNFKAVSIIGDGRGSVIKVATGTAFTHPLFSWGGGASNVRIENLTVDLNNNPQPAALTLIFNFTSLQGVSVRNVALINASANMYLTSFNNCNDILVDSCTFRVITGSSTVQSKAVAFSTSLGACTSIRLVNNTLVNTNIEFAGVSQIYIAGNDISGWGVGAGIGLDAGSGSSLTTILGNKCHDSLTNVDMYGFNCNGIENWAASAIIANNECWNCCGAGIFVGGANCMVVGNVCWDNNTFSGTPVVNSGIALGVAGANNSSGSVIVANHCYDSGVNRQNYGFRINNLGITGLTLNANHFNGYQGDVYLLANATYLNNTDYVPRILSADPTTALGAATKQYVDGRGSGSRLLYETTTSVGNGADTTVDVLQTFTVPANTLKAVGDRVSIRAAGSYIGSTDSKTVALTWGGGSNVLALVASTASGVTWCMDATFIKTAANAQTYTARANTNSNVTAAGATTRTAPDTAGIVINVTGQNATNATANSVTCTYLTVDYVAAA